MLWLMMMTWSYSIVKHWRSFKH